PEINVPTLVVHGRRDAFFPVGNGEAIAREVPGARLLVLEEAATAIPDAAAGEVAEAMLALGEGTRVLRGNGIRAAVGAGGSRVRRAPIAGADRGHDAPPSGSGRRVAPSVTGIGAWPSWLGVGPAGVGDIGLEELSLVVFLGRNPVAGCRGRRPPGHP